MHRPRNKQGEQWNKRWRIYNQRTL